MPGEAVGLLLVCKGSVKLVSYFHLLQFCSGLYLPLAHYWVLKLHYLFNLRWQNSISSYC